LFEVIWSLIRAGVVVCRNLLRRFIFITSHIKGNAACRAFCEGWRASCDILGGAAKGKAKLKADRLARNFYFCYTLLAGTVFAKTANTALPLFLFLHCFCVANIP
jgi:hypothetical protein